MKKRTLNKELFLKKVTVSSLTEEEIKGGTFGTYFVDLCYGAQTSFFGICAAKCAPPGH
ncbi:hypothetical protein IMCC3317_08780 [Kordia antarctica]|uniref:Uncharacterized protein n=1 Tax=Kordia antarctica TaxID=1218801 RepID=A0A7L4ZFU5_9FLAO|nr:class I lanthipeptide [Kordia antarctica]QHI35532.1 hypothetical protein IMCC3317_08780 [Kordia antarctica]